MATWGEFAAAAPELAAEGRQLLYRHGNGKALLATVRGNLAPRIHPISVGIVADHLYAFILSSPKLGDLQGDGRYAMHAYPDPVAPSEFSIRGRARVVADEGARSAAAASWPFAADATYLLFEFDVETAVLGVRPTADDWPPRYRSWRAGRSG